MPYGGLFDQNEPLATQTGDTDAEHQLRTSVGPSTHTHQLHFLFPQSDSLKTLTPFISKR